MKHVLTSVETVSRDTGIGHVYRDEEVAGVVTKCARQSGCETVYYTNFFYCAAVRTRVVGSSGYSATELEV